jgi:transglutaminase-like putative cysteine protease/Ca2+/Na+ antiporter
MSFSTYFRLTSYATVAAAALALFVAHGVGTWLAVGFALITIAAWKFEETRWQLSERVALIIIIASLPLFYVDWRILTVNLDLEFLETSQRTNVEVTVLAHLILFLSAVKLLQVKADRDWFFLYLISFFVVLLAAGLSTSPVFLLTLTLYLLCILSTVVAFEIQKARRKVQATQTRILIAPDSTIFRKLSIQRWRRRYHETRRLPLVSLALLLFIVVLALPFFLIAPRTRANALTRSGNGLAGMFVGFSDRVRLGEIGRLKRSDEIVMHVRLEANGAGSSKDLRWRGVALDEFTGREWIKSSTAQRFEKKESDSGLFQVGTTEDLRRLTAQTFFVEPLDTPVLFGLPRIVAVQGRLPFVRVDSEGSAQSRPHDQERAVYRVYSDTLTPDPSVLRADGLDYYVSAARYLALRDNLDPRIKATTKDVIARAGARNGYDAARAVESYLRDNYGYTLDLKAGGPDPLADFLFNVKEGHCEYFSTAMAVMLRTQGVATRVVNGFLPGQFNEAADAFTVRQSDAHSWVEVYFSETNSWVTFDPTPAAGRTPRVRSGLAAQLSKYSEALELMWFQYVIGYDKQEQRSLAASWQNRLFDLRRGAAVKLDQARRSWPSAVRPLLLGLIALGAVIMSVALGLRIRRQGWRRGLKVWGFRTAPESSRVDFYERLIALLEKRGLKRAPHQTPLEFASDVGIPEAFGITEAYNRVRYGAEKLSASERKQIEELLSVLERKRSDD